MSWATSSRTSRLKALGEASQPIPDLLQIDGAAPCPLLGLPEVFNRVRYHSPGNPIGVMAHVEVGRIEKRVSCQSLCRLRIFGCRRVESDTSRLDRIKSAAIDESVPASEPNRVHVAASQLGRLRSGLCLCGIERVEVQTMPFPAEIKDEPEIVAGKLSVAVDLHCGRTRLYDDWKFLFGFGLGGHGE